MTESDNFPANDVVGGCLFLPIEDGWVNNPHNAGDCHLVGGGGSDAIWEYLNGWTVHYGQMPQGFDRCGERYPADDTGSCGWPKGHRESPHAWTWPDLCIVSVNRRVPVSA